MHCSAEAGAKWRSSGQESHRLVSLPKFPSGPTVLSYRALGNRQRSKEESENERPCTPFLHRTARLLPECQELEFLRGSSSRDNELDLLVFTRKLGCSKPGCEFTAS